MANQIVTADGQIGNIQLSDGNGLLKSSNKLHYSTNTLYSPLYKGDGGCLSNIGGLTKSGAPGEVLVYTAGTNVGGDPGFTYYQPLQMLSIGGSVNIGGDLIVSGNTYSEDTIVFNNPIIEIGKSALLNSTIGLLFTRPTGNVMLGMESNTLISSGSVQVFGNVSANNFLITSSQVTLGLGAGIAQPPNSVCIGTGANTNSTSSIVISGNGPLVNTPSNPGFYVSPIRINPFGNILTINTFSNEITSSFVPIDTLITNSNIFLKAGEDYYGSITGSNTINASTISSLDYFGAITGSNNINASTIYSMSISGANLFGNTITTSTIYATITNSLSISGADLFGNIVGSNTVSASTISVDNLYASTISAGAITTNLDISGANLFGNIAGSNTITASTISVENLLGNTVNASTISVENLFGSTISALK